jgi:hypothetical protein
MPASWELLRTPFGDQPLIDSVKKLLWLIRRGGFARPMTRPRHIIGRASRIAQESWFFSRFWFDDLTFLVSRT